jgi:hypothetical protein
VSNVDGSHERQIQTPQGGLFPDWSPDGSADRAQHPGEGLFETCHLWFLVCLLAFSLMLVPGLSFLLAGPGARLVEGLARLLVQPGAIPSNSSTRRNRCATRLEEPQRPAIPLRRNPRAGEP